jgi:photosystem II stability/assembly factor-like uncharacterized protein
VSFTDASNGWAVGSGGTIVHTSDGGLTWTPQNSGTSSGLSSVVFLAQASAVPEPSSLALLGAGFGALVAWRRGRGRSA